MGKNFTVVSGKTIRDPVHGDIFIPNRFLDIVDTPEFQRLRRIRQLSISYLVFPGAEHTRFSHSIGTYYIMQKIIDHFIPMFESINLEVEKRDIDLALAAALLHDVGHGPFSHAFEKAIPGRIDHEDWTIRIITDPGSDVNRILKENFGIEFPSDLADIIRKERSVKKGAPVDGESQSLDLFFVLSSLISGQLDADRMDYLIRDSMHTGVMLGEIDIERIISSMIITTYGDNYYVCMMDKYLSDIENYLFARYQMHKEVYLHDVKCEMELVIKKIFERAMYVYRTNRASIENTLPEALVKLFEGRDITVEEYNLLDDNVLLAAFSNWMDIGDPILKKLCSCIINRDKYKRVHILNNTREDIYEFTKELRIRFAKYGYTIKSLEDEYFWLESVEPYNIYKKHKENVWIIKNDGIIKDISDVSKIINEELNGSKNMTFIKYDFIDEIEELGDASPLIADIKDLVRIYNNRNYIEIEKKYVFGDKDVFDRVTGLLMEWGEYEIDAQGERKTQTDYYYDTESKDLFNENKTLRFRKKDDGYQLTIKMPTKGEDITGDNINPYTQSERFEFEMPVISEDKDTNKTYITKYLSELRDEDKWNSLQRTLTVVNNRQKLNLLKNDVIFEMVYDDVTYMGEDGTEHKDYQIEIELKSNYIHRANLKMLSDYLEDKIPELSPINDSKYKRGLMLTGND